MATRTALTRRDVDTAKVYVVTDGFVGTLPDGTEVTFLRDQRIRGEHQAVKQWPQLFVEDGVPMGEWPVPPSWRHMDEVAEAAGRAMREEQARREPAPIPIERQLRVRQAFRQGLTRSFAEGELVDKDDPKIAKLIAEHPRYFEIPGRPLA